jgi:hypothetical protein
MAANRKGSMDDGAPLVETVADTFVPGGEENVEQVQKAKETTKEKEEEYDSRKMDPDEEVWDGGPVFRQINAWKDQYGDVFVTSVTPEKHIVWRTLTRSEYRNLVKVLEKTLSTGSVSQGEANLNNEESIAEMCILYPPYKRDSQAGEMAGIASTIAQQVMEASAFVSVEVRQL